MKKINKVKLITYKAGIYFMYVFQNVETYEYIICTKVPNWNSPFINIGDIGYLEYQIVQAGDTYFDSATLETKTYLYSNVYFINFILESSINTQTEIIL